MSIGILVGIVALAVASAYVPVLAPAARTSARAIPSMPTVSSGVVSAKPSVTTTTVPVPTAFEVWLASDASKCIQKGESTTIDGVTYDETARGNIWQFEVDTFYGITGLTGPAGSYPPEVQHRAAYKLYLARGWQPWPNTSVACGLR